MPLRREELNSLKLQKGKIGENRFPILDSVKDCDNICKLWEECPYDKKKNGEVVKCKLQAGFLRTMMDIVLQNLPQQNQTEYHLQKIGLSLLPLYKQLVIMHMEELSLTSPVVGEDGKLKVHPIYKEIRIITRDIDKCLLSLGIGKNVAELGEGVDPKNMLHGDSSYYEEMQAGHEEESASFIVDKPRKRMKGKKVV